MSITCYVALGSNLDLPRRRIHHAMRLMHRIPRTQVTKKSSIHFSQAQGLRAQPGFYNAVVRLETTLSPQHLLRCCQTLEVQQGRVRKQHWGARTLDIDLLLFGTLECTSPELTIPHPRLTSRDFVLVPLLEINPALCLPNGLSLQTARQMLTQTFIV